MTADFLAAAELAAAGYWWLAADCLASPEPGGPLGCLAVWLACLLLAGCLAAVWLARWLAASQLGTAPTSLPPNLRIPKAKR